MANATEQVKLGAALIDRSLLVSLERLWQGPLSPEDIPKIELALRAFLTASELIASRTFQLRTDLECPARPAIDYEQPFGDHLLDYEFRDPSLPHPYGGLSNAEYKLLTIQFQAFSSKALSVVPKTFTREGECLAYLDSWFQGESLEACHESAELMLDWEEFRKPIQSKSFSIQHHIDTMLDHAQYIVKSARSGLMVYGKAPIYKFCNEHTFTKWPNLLHSLIKKKYHRLLDELHGPRVRLILPPLTSIVLARIRFRSEIPKVIIELRAEYESARRELWEIMEQVWNGKTLNDRIDAVHLLRDSAKNAFNIAHKKRKNILSFGAGFVANNSLDINAELLECFDKLDESHVNQLGVCAISFARKLGEEMESVLATELTKFKSHFSESEIRNLNL